MLLLQSRAACVVGVVSAAEEPVLKDVNLIAAFHVEVSSRTIPQVLSYIAAMN